VIKVETASFILIPLIVPIMIQFVKSPGNIYFFTPIKCHLVRFSTLDMCTINDTINIMNWGYYIKILREEARLTQQELADKSGLKRSHYSNIESGRYKAIKPEVLRKIAPLE